MSQQQILLVAGGAAAAVLLIAVLLRWFRRAPAPSQTGGPDLRIDIGQLGEHGPPETPRLHVYGTPVRLAAVVVAAAGRGTPIPGVDQAARMLDDVVPGLAAVATAHQAAIRVWPSQLSAQGFTQSFFNQAALPGDRGKGSRWCSVAGKFPGTDHAMLAGLICVAQQSNSLGQITVQHEGQWLDVIRVSE